MSSAPTVRPAWWGCAARCTIRKAFWCSRGSTAICCAGPPRVAAATHRKGTASAQGPREAQLVPVRIGQVEVSLAPFGIARRRLRMQAGRERAGVETIDIGMMEDHAAPPRPLARALGDQVEEARSSAEAGERGRLAAIGELEAERAIESHGADHVMGRKRDGAD